MGRHRNLRETDEKLPSNVSVVSGIQFVLEATPSYFVEGLAHVLLYILCLDLW